MKRNCTNSTCYYCCLTQSRHNKMQLNVKKTKEVFHCPNPRFSLPDLLPHIKRVSGLKLLGVFLNANFKFDEHVNKTLCLCSQRMYLLKQPKSQGLGIKQLDTVFTALIVSRVFTLSLPGVASWVPTCLIKLIPSCVKRINLAIPPSSSKLRICCNTQIISSFRLCYELVTASYITSRPQSDWCCPP